MTADPYFDAPFVLVDEWRDWSHGHRHVHGAFGGTKTLFAFSFPDAHEYGSRFVQDSRASGRPRSARLRCRDRLWGFASVTADLRAIFADTWQAWHDAAPIQDEGAAYASRLRAAGVPTELIEGVGMCHGFYGFQVDEAQPVASLPVGALRAALHSGAPVPAREAP